MFKKKIVQVWMMVSIRGCGETEICILGWNTNASFVVNSLPVSPKEVTYRERNLI